MTGIGSFYFSRVGGGTVSEVVRKNASRILGILVGERQVQDAWCDQGGTFEWESAL